VRVVLAAHRQLLNLQRQELQLLEMQGAQISSLLFNINRDARKAKATSYKDWLFFAPQEQKPEGDELPPVVAHICLALRHEEKLPPLLMGIWRDVIKRSGVPAEVPEIRALVNAERSVVAVAPAWEGANLRVFLAAKGEQPGSVIELQDVDRPLLRYRLKLPLNLQPVHFEAAVLLINQDRSEKLLGASSS
jgi:hypothetical protein